DRAATPHGPAELVDILTHRIEIDSQPGWAAFILKGRSFKTVRHSDVSHQIYRLEKIDDLNLAIFTASVVELIPATDRIQSTSSRLNDAQCYIDADDLSRWLWDYGFLCPRDGQRITGGRCSCGYAPRGHPLNLLQVEALRELKTCHRLGQQRALIVLPPGTG